MRLGDAADGELVRRAQDGDRDAFDRLLKRHGSLVLSIARSVTRHREDAEDVAQDVFVRLFRTIGRVDPERPLEPWLVRMTLNAARSHVARSPARTEGELDEAHPAAARGSTQADHVRAGEFRRALSLALATLTEREREVFILREVHELEVVVIAQALGTAEVTIRRQSSDGRRKIIAWFRRNRPELVTSAPGLRG